MTVDSAVRTVAAATGCVSLFLRLPSLRAPSGGDQHCKWDGRQEDVLQLVGLRWLRNDEIGTLGGRQRLAEPHFVRIVCELLPAFQADDVSRAARHAGLVDKGDGTGQASMSTAEEQV